MKGIILTGGNISDYDKIKSYITPDAILICADSGYNHAVQMNLKPHCVVGDMDSIGEIPEQIPIRKFPVDKDQTDTELAIEAALQEGCTELVLLGASGIRLDHSLANILLLTKLEHHGIVAELIDEHNRMRVISQSSKWTANSGDTISLIPLSNCTGVVTTGLVYPLNGEMLQVGSTRGISNRFLSDSAVVDLASGSLLVVLAND